MAAKRPGLEHFAKPILGHAYSPLGERGHGGGESRRSRAAWDSGLTRVLQIVCVSSVEELKQLSGRDDITDLHRENIDPILIPSQQGKGMLKRIEEVFDCWFESGR